MLSELCGNGWTVVDPPALNDVGSVIGRYHGEPVKAGIVIEKLEDSQSNIHYRYRTGQYNLDVRIDFDIGRGWVKVEEADGYDGQ